MKEKSTYFVVALVAIVLALTLVAFSPAFSAIRAKLLCATETGNCVEGWNGTDVTLYRDPGGTETIRMDGAGAVRIAVPTQVGTATPGLVIQAGANSNPVEVRNSGGTPVFQIAPDGGVTSQNTLATGAQNNVVINVPTAGATATAGLYLNNLSAGASSLDINDSGTPQLQVYNGGGVRAYAPTAVATAVPAVIIDSAGVSNLLELRKNATPVFSVAGDGTNVLATGSVSSGEIADVTRNVPLPLMGWIDCTTDAGAALNFSSGADAFPDFINSSTDGLGFTLTFDDTGGTEDTVAICASITVPSDYVSGGAVVARVTKDAETGTNTEVLTCAGSINGAALGSTGTATLTGTASAVATCTPTLSSLAAGDSLALTAYITSDGTMDDTVNIHSIQFTYTATQ